jgi:hypothetical protein
LTSWISQRKAEALGLNRRYLRSLAAQGYIRTWQLPVDGVPVRYHLDDVKAALAEPATPPPPKPPKPLPKSRQGEPAGV